MKHYRNVFFSILKTSVGNNLRHSETCRRQTLNVKKLMQENKKNEPTKSSTTENIHDRQLFVTLQINQKISPHNVQCCSCSQACQGHVQEKHTRQSFPSLCLIQAWPDDLAYIWIELSKFVNHYGLLFARTHYRKFMPPIGGRLTNGCWIRTWIILK